MFCKRLASSDGFRDSAPTSSSFGEPMPMPTHTKLRQTTFVLRDTSQQMLQGDIVRHYALYTCTQAP